MPIPTTTRRVPLHTPSLTLHPLQELAVALAVVLAPIGAAAFAQEVTSPADPPQSSAPQAMTSPDMQEMAKAMTAMAETCQTMMEREMAMMPYVAIGSLILGILLAAVLVLLLVLEIQCIRFLGVRVRTERRKLK